MMPDHDGWLKEKQYQEEVAVLIYNVRQSKHQCLIEAAMLCRQNTVTIPLDVFQTMLEIINRTK